MFHVIVLGGIGLVACGGVVAGNLGDASPDAVSDAFPSEGKPLPDAFPGELPARIDASPDSFPSETFPAPEAGKDSFPTEGPAMLDSGDAKVSDAFPSETGHAPDAFPHEA
jgi:hypothetical protein